MCGDVGCFLSDDEDAQTGQVTRVAEISVMTAVVESRRKGIAREAEYMFAFLR
ncbi:hypothetical protein Pmar_PMAR007428 [Perkinsus marinus ATCC 50983]|uniref:Uncharacterized protein n=1 Tax=Perkinsus marinus (strain ATCC 50983 / TXsc) TaxID=423536 RepID=C5L963_PERM5|nr:hypothetical protein Pmar_PMAR007428 [Perkinsus marinus ATCC 50983]EER06711.1 hypothetical protein Pmar_PMAR007428 [Perkinsus marinus ATCC 50983]|eukprot:XP_002774895.1 hypothetical protein Pmar_PMAR007428 [Perkinsus marinus ATCC 50983]